MSARSLSAELHSKLSALIMANAVFPAHDPKHGLDLLDIVLVEPKREKGQLFTPAGINLEDVVPRPATNEAPAGEIVEVPPSPHRKGLAAHSGLAAAISGQFVNAGAGIELDGLSTVDLLVGNKASRSLKSPGRIRGLVEGNFVALLRELHNIGAVSKAFMFGVITSVITGKLEAKVINTRAAGAEAIVTTDITGAQLSIGAQQSALLRISEQGIIGIQVMCFVCIAGKNGNFQVSAPMYLVRAEGRYFDAGCEMVGGGFMNKLKIFFKRLKPNLFQGQPVAVPEDAGLPPPRGNLSDDSSSDEDREDEVPPPDNFGGVNVAELWEEYAGGGRDEFLIATDPAALDGVAERDELEWAATAVLPDGLPAV